MKIKKDTITGLLLIALGAVIAVMVSKFRYGMTWEYPGPKLFPLIAVFGFVVCGAGIFLSSIFGHKEDKVFLTGAGWLKTLSLFVMLALYILGLKYLGYMIVTPFVLFIFCTIIARGGDVKASLIGRIIFSVVFTLLIYVVYVHVFNMTLPTGIFFD
ncbi:MAG: tripartite tricarboxylate transporter TctB family protein [Candidatus Heteroscillospira sp.]